MDAIEILGGLLRGGNSGTGGSGAGASGGGMGGKILQDLIKRGMNSGTRSSPASPAPASPAPRQRSVKHQPLDIQSEASRLEELLGVAVGGGSGGGGQTGGRQAPNQRSGTPQTPQRQIPRQETSTRQAPQRQTGSAEDASIFQDSGPDMSTQQEALILVQAMINAAKADGKLDSKEQEFILSRVPNDAKTIQFLRQEFARPLDVREFTWNVPLGMEVQVYTLSLATIDVDTGAEKEYLSELARGLRLHPDLCSQIHQQLGVPGRIRFNN
jgi:uncharacterized membrane protein YebE (DUF533 family)